MHVPSRLHKSVNFYFAYCETIYTRFQNNMAGSKLKRKPRFSDGEIRSLIHLFAEHQDVLLSKFNNLNTNEKKKKVWAEITTAVNARAVGVKRTVVEVKKKWKDLSSKAKKDASSQKNPSTGGGPRQHISPYSDIILDIYGKESPSVIGIANAIESASASVSLAVEEEKECREYDAVSIITQETRSPTKSENNKRQDPLTSEGPEIGEEGLSELESQLVEGILMFTLFKFSYQFLCVCRILQGRLFLIKYICLL